MRARQPNTLVVLGASAPWRSPCLPLSHSPIQFHPLPPPQVCQISKRTHRLCQIRPSSQAPRTTAHHPARFLQNEPTAPLHVSCLHVSRLSPPPAKTPQTIPNSSKAPHQRKTDRTKPLAIMAVEITHRAPRSSALSVCCARGAGGLPGRGRIRGARGRWARALPPLPAPSRRRIPRARRGWGRWGGPGCRTGPASPGR
jgi:hypothetical protein